MSSEILIPDEPCVVLGDGRTATVATDRSSEQIRQWALSVGPLGRATMSARLRALADIVDRTSMEERA